MPLCKSTDIIVLAAPHGKIGKLNSRKRIRTIKHSDKIINAYPNYLINWVKIISMQVLTPSLYYALYKYDVDI